MKRCYFLYVIAVTTTICLLSASGIADISLAQNEGFPFYPSLFNTVNAKPAKFSDFMPYDKCKECHKRIYTQWEGSIHANAYRDPVWQKLFEIGSKETDGKIDKFCIGCHAPAGLATGSLLSFKDMQKEANPLVQNGVQCDMCHLITGSSADDTPSGVPGNGSVILDPGEKKHGPYKPNFMVQMLAGHKLAYSEMLGESTFCANCHNMFNPQNNHPLATTYNEWEDTIYAEKGITCQNCHMVNADETYQVATGLKPIKKPGLASERGPNRKSIHDHFIMGGNFAIADMLGAKDKARIARDRLTKVAEMELILPQAASKGSTAELGVKVTNVAAGHNLPTGINELRQMWLEVLVQDAAGKEIFSSGKLDAKGNIDPEAVIFNAKIVDKEGNPTLKPWKMDHIEYDHSIKAKESRTSTYKLNIPADAQSPLTISATLRYRSFPQSFINELFKDKTFTIPIADMTAKKAELNL